MSAAVLNDGPGGIMAGRMLPPAMLLQLALDAAAARLGLLKEHLADAVR